MTNNNYYYNLKKLAAFQFSVFRSELKFTEQLFSTKQNASIIIWIKV